LLGPAEGVAEPLRLRAGVFELLLTGAGQPAKADDRRPGAANDAVAVADPPGEDGTGAQQRPIGLTDVVDGKLRIVVGAVREAIARRTAVNVSTVTSCTTPSQCCSSTERPVDVGITSKP
jgi:hypothetical protein